MPSFPQVNDDVQLRYAQLQELIGGLLDVHDDMKDALAARLRLFRQKGFPPQADTGSARKFIYDMDAVVRVALAFQLMDGLVPQEAVPRVIESAWPQIRSAFADAYRSIAQRGGQAAGVHPERSIMVIRLRNLQHFSKSKDGGDHSSSGAAGEAATMKAKVMSASEFEREWSSGDATTPLHPFIVLDLQRLATWLRDAMIASRWCGPEAFTKYQEIENAIA